MGVKARFPYTKEGEPWAALDAWNVRMLFEAALASSSTRKTLSSRLHMALICYTRINKKSGCFGIGIDALADAAGVSERQARGFFEALEKSGYIVKVGSAPNGCRQYRAFSWHENVIDRDAIARLYAKHHDGSPSQNVTLQNTDKQMGAGVFVDATPDQLKELARLRKLKEAMNG